MKIEKLSLEDAVDYLLKIPCLSKGSGDDYFTRSECWIDIGRYPWSRYLQKLYNQEDKHRLYIMGLHPAPSYKESLTEKLWNPKLFAKHRYMYTFEEFWEVAPDEVKADLIFHIDMFR